MPPGMRDCYDREGRPITILATWLRLMQDPEYRRVELTDLGELGYVSTVWLGLDHSWGRGRPLIFETMHFPSNDCERWSTLEEARAGHARWVERVKRGETG